MSYQRPIIIEIYAELFLEPGTFPFAQMLEVVSLLRGRGFGVVESADVADADLDGSEGPERRPAHVPRIRCWTEDRTRLIQLAPDNVAMNLVSPEGTYPGWEPFVSHVVRPTCEILRQTASRARPVSLALNTLDRFEIPRGLPLGEFLNCGGPRIPSILADTTQAFDYDIGRGLLESEGQNRQLHISGRPGTATYLVNIHAVFHQTIPESGDILLKLEQLHDDANTVFESLITDRTRNEVMKGNVHAATSL
ncbi:MAG: TIGR04255 family protein [Acidobacteriota bacterium]